MKLMTYNILNGGEERLPQIIEVIKNEAPDLLTINEANGFEKYSNRKLKDFAKQIGFTYFFIALSGEFDYHVAVFSKFPFVDIDKLHPLARACIMSTIRTDLGTLSIASLHLTPYSEDQRLPEIKLILKHLKNKEHTILMGDFNSLAKTDEYEEAMVEHFNDMQMEKFTSDGKLIFNVVNTILSSGFIDSAVQMKKNKEYTAPTSINEYDAHSNMRLDYLFLSKSLQKHLRRYSVLKNTLTEIASDHYPIIVVLN